MERERGGARFVIVGLERILVGVERDFGVDHQQLVARDAHDRIGAQAPFLGVDRSLGHKIGVFRKAALFQHVAQLQFAPAAARLGPVAQRITQLCRLGPHRLLPVAQRLDQPGQIAEGIDTVLFQLAHLLFVGLEPFVDRGEQCFQPFALRLFAFFKAGLRAQQEAFLRAFEHFAAGVLEFLAQGFLRFDQQPLLFGKVGGIGLQRGQFPGQRIARGAYLRQFGRQRTHLGLRAGGFGLRRCQRGAERIAFGADRGKLGRLPVEQRGAFGLAGKIDGQLLDQIFLRGGARAPFGHRARAREPADRQPGDDSNDGNHDVHGLSPVWNEPRT